MQEAERGGGGAHLVYYFWKFCAKVDYNFTVAKQAAPVSQCPQLQQRPQLQPPQPGTPFFYSTLPIPASNSSLTTFTRFPLGQKFLKPRPAPAVCHYLLARAVKVSEREGEQRQYAQVGSALLGYGSCTVSGRGSVSTFYAN